jgi:DNA-binding XRE family transcriptional regulator
VHCIKDRSQALAALGMRMLPSRRDFGVDFAHDQVISFHLSELPSQHLLAYVRARQSLKLAMKIAKLREKKGLSQQQMAKLIGTSQQAVSRIESGEYEGFTLKTLEKIAEATGTKVKIEFVTA